MILSLLFISYYPYIINFIIQPLHCNVHITLIIWLSHFHETIRLLLICIIFWFIYYFPSVILLVVCELQKFIIKFIRISMEKFLVKNNKSLFYYYGIIIPWYYNNVNNMLYAFHHSFIIIYISCTYIAIFL